MDLRKFFQPGDTVKVPEEKKNIKDMEIYEKISPSGDAYIVESVYPNYLVARYSARNTFSGKISDKRVSFSVGHLVQAGYSLSEVEG